MTLLAVPNVSEGRDRKLLLHFARAVEKHGVRVLDVHTDAVHNRSVLTLTGTPDELVAGCTALADAAGAIDLTAHEGVHPRLGGLDVCPFVPYGSDMADAAATARATAARIGAELELPVYLYGHAAARSETRELPDLRRGGLATIAHRARNDLPPDAGPAEIDLRRGVVCVGARGPLIAFNVWLAAGVQVAHAIAKEVRSASVRALGLGVAQNRSQVSMNLIDPVEVGIEETFERIEMLSANTGAEIVATELVGLVERRFLPIPDATVARLLLEPGHCLEERLLGES